MISKLVLQGPKIYGSLLVKMVQLQAGQNLKSLSFVNVKTTQKTKLELSITDFFRSLPRVEELHVPQELATAAGNLRLALLNPLSAARSGPSTLLKVLRLGGCDYLTAFRRLNLSDLEQIGELMSMAQHSADTHFNFPCTHGS